MMQWGKRQDALDRQLPVDSIVSILKHLGGVPYGM